MMCSLVLQLWSIVDELVKDLLMSQEVLIKFLISTLKVMSLLYLIVDSQIILLIIEHLESEWVS